VIRFVLASLWLAFVLFLGSAPFAAQETGRFILPVLQLAMPGTSAGQLQAIHMVIRKLAHITEYAVLALLWFKAFDLAGRSARTAAGAALSICLACAFADEVHQSTLPTRQGSARDFVIDAFGATAMLVVARGAPKNRGAAFDAPAPRPSPRTERAARLRPRARRD